MGIFHSYVGLPEGIYSDDNQPFGAERPFALPAVQMRSGAPKKDAQASEVWNQQKRGELHWKTTSWR